MSCSRVLSQRPILVKGHERALTMVKYNREGDLLFTVSKDHVPSVWYADNGEHIGTYIGHTGAVWCVDVNFSSTLLLTGSADNSAKLWNVKTGELLFVFVHPAPVRAVNFALGDRRILTALDNIMGNKATISIYELSPDVLSSTEGQEKEPVLKITGHTGKINRALWGPLNKTIISCSDDATIRVWSSETGEQLQMVSGQHKDKITDIQFSWDFTFLISASKDGTARLFDLETLEPLKVYETDRPLNSATISPLKECPYVVVGGGQDAMSVTTTSSKMGKLDALFFHMIFEDELGSVKGHFGPINTMQMAPHGRRYVGRGSTPPAGEGPSGGSRPPPLCKAMRAAVRTATSASTTLTRTTSPRRRMRSSQVSKSDRSHRRGGDGTSDGPHGPSPWAARAQRTLYRVRDEGLADQSISRGTWCRRARSKCPGAVPRL